MTEFRTGLSKKFTFKNYAAGKVRRSTLLGLLLAALLGGLLVGVPKLMGIVEEWTHPQKPEVAEKQAKDLLSLHPGAPFKVKRAVNLIGLQLVQLRYKPTSQEFIVVKGETTKKATEEMFNNSISSNTVENLGNGALKLIRPGKKDEFIIDKFETTQSTPLKLDGKTIPCKQIKLTFHLNSSAKLRTYSGTIGRMPQPDGEEALFVTFGREEQFNPELMATFIENITLNADG